MVTTLAPQQAFLILNALPHIGPITLNRLLEHFDQDPVAILSAPPKELCAVKGVGETIARTLNEWTTYFDLDREERMLERTGIRFVTCRDPEYPAALKEIHDPPIGFYRKGDLADLTPSVAIVGSRRTTLYGQGIAMKLAAGLARAGICIVSGLARGIDTFAHEGALDVDGKTVAVLGCGLDIVYPPENLDLYKRLAERGAILSEFPFGRRADRQTFPMRNRIVAGLSEAVIVVESDTSGGSMITARFAGEQGRMVFAVPGRIDQPSSAGCHQLLRDGAILCRHAEDVLSELSYLRGMRPLPIPNGTDSVGKPSILANASEEELAVLRHFENGEILNIDRLAELTGQPPYELSPLLLMLELKHAISKRVDGTFQAR